MARGRFELPASVESARGDYRERLDSVRGFVVERATLHANCWAPRSLLYRAYRTWAQESGRFALSAATFNDHLRRGFVGRVEERKREGTWGWVGIGVLEDSGR
jgi:phage/plasmid-associated DNA primase